MCAPLKEASQGCLAAFSVSWICPSYIKYTDFHAPLSCSKAFLAAQLSSAYLALVRQPQQTLSSHREKELDHSDSVAQQPTPNWPAKVHIRGRRFPCQTLLKCWHCLCKDPYWSAEKRVKTHSNHVNGFQPSCFQISALVYSQHSNSMPF